jgi:hypothetical protein
VTVLLASSLTSSILTVALPLVVVIMAFAFLITVVRRRGDQQ